MDALVLGPYYVEPMGEAENQAGGRKVRSAAARRRRDKVLRGAQGRLESRSR